MDSIVSFVRARVCVCVSVLVFRFVKRWCECNWVSTDARPGARSVR